MSTSRRYRFTDKQRNSWDRMNEQAAAWRAEHTAKYGEHVCTPDLNDPWSTCDREKASAS